MKLRNRILMILVDGEKHRWKHLLSSLHHLQVNGELEATAQHWLQSPAASGGTDCGSKNKTRSWRLTADAAAMTIINQQSSERASSGWDEGIQPYDGIWIVNCWLKRARVPVFLNLEPRWITVLIAVVRFIHFFRDRVICETRALVLSKGCSKRAVGHTRETVISERNSWKGVSSLIFSGEYRRAGSGDTMSHCALIMQRCEGCFAYLSEGKHKTPQPASVTASGKRRRFIDALGKNWQPRWTWGAGISSGHERWNLRDCAVNLRC